MTAHFLQQLFDSKCIQIYGLSSFLDVEHKTIQLWYALILKPSPRNPLKILNVAMSFRILISENKANNIIKLLTLSKQDIKKVEENVKVRFLIKIFNYLGIYNRLKHEGADRSQPLQNPGLTRNSTIILSTLWSYINSEN